MKNKIYLYLVALLPLFMACKSDKSESETSQITLSSLSAELGPELSSVTVQVKSSGDWRLSGKKTWCVPSSVEGVSGDEVVFTIEPNTTQQVRKITYTFFTDHVAEKYEVIQYPEDFFHYDSEVNYELTDEEQTLLLSVKTNKNYVVSVPEDCQDWIIVPSAGAETKESRIKVVVKENDTYKKRQGHLTILSDDQSHEVAINQEQNDAILLEGEEKIVVGLEEQILVIPIQTNVPIKVELIYNSKNWMTVLPIDNELSGDGLATKEIRLKLSESVHSRSGSIAIHADKANFYKKYELTLEQKNPNAVVVEFEDPELVKTLERENLVYVMESGLCEMTPSGMATTTLRLGSSPISSIQGIEAFSNLQSLDISRSMVEVIDVSGCEKLDVLECKSIGVNTIKLGNSKVKTLDVSNFLFHIDGRSGFKIVAPTELTIEGESLETLDVSLSDYNYKDMHKLQTLDVSACPNLKTLHATSLNKYFNKIILKEGQEISNLEKSEWTQIEYVK